MKAKRKFEAFKIWFAILTALFTQKVNGELLMVTQPTSLQCVSTDDNPGALQWILPTGANTATKITKQSSVWKSQDTKDQFYCNFSQFCSSLRQDNVQSNTEIETPELNFGPVTDTRWNNFPIKNEKDYQKLPLQDRSVLHMSVLAEDDGFLILSRTTDSTNRGAYVFVLDEWSKSRSVLRKCSHGIHEKGHDDEKRPCLELKTVNNSKVLADGNQWVHFTIEITKTRHKYNFTTTIDIKLKVNGQVYLEWFDNRKLIDVFYVSFRRYDNKPAFWKYHEYKVFKQDENIIDIPINVTHDDDKVCVSMTYFSSNDVTLDILTSNITLKTKSIKPTNATWQVERFEARIPLKEEYKLQINKNPVNNFYLGEVRSCTRSDFFVTILEIDNLNSQLKIKCKRSNHDLKDNEGEYKNNSCLEGEFGPNCELSCSKIVGTKCSRGKVCTETRGCFCLPGYKTMNTNCQNECDPGAYGQDCRRTCGNCASSSCDKQTGECTRGCISQDYKTPFCNHEYLIFQRSQFNIQALEDGSVEFQVTPSQITFLQEIQNFKVLLQSKDTSGNIWKNSSNLIDLPLQKSVLIPGLRANTQYEIRPVLLQVDGKGYIGNDIPSVTVTTQCNIIDSNKISITSVNLTALQVDWDNNYNLSCSLQNYTIQVNENPIELLQVLPYIVSNLVSGSKNEVIVYKGEQEIKNETVELFAMPMDIITSFFGNLSVLIPTMVSIISIASCTAVSIACYVKNRRLKRNLATVIKNDVQMNAAYDENEYAEIGPMFQCASAGQDEDVNERPPVPENEYEQPRNFDYDDVTNLKLKLDQPGEVPVQGPEYLQVLPSGSNA